MCVPYMRERAESLSNYVMAQSPEIIVIVNDEMEILEFNAAAERAFFGCPEMKHRKKSL